VEIHAVRILAMEPTTEHTRRKFYNHAHERLRILGEIPVRKFPGGLQPFDADGNPDTSFLAKIPADVGFTFQTVDEDGLLLNMAQTWHQLRPGEIRNDCGGCHAHSQKPTLFQDTAAARADYPIFDLTGATPLVTSRAKDESKRQWDVTRTAGLRYVGGPVNVEYFRDVKPILERSCVACHSGKGGKEPAGNLDLDADHETVNAQHLGNFPGTYYRLAVDEAARYSHKPAGWPSWGTNNASRYIRKWQARRSLLVWKILGRRTDGFSNDDHPTETVPGDIKTLAYKGKPVPDPEKHRHRADLDFTGSAMPPPEAVKAGKVPPLSDEDGRTLFRWIDLGCPIDLDYDPKQPARRGEGWMADDKRPTLTVTWPKAGANARLDRVLVGMHDYYTGIEPGSFEVRADFAIDGVPAGQDLGPRFREKCEGVRELKLEKPIRELGRGKLTVAVKDRQGNRSCVERTFSVKK
jgi:hypothetical protein